MRGGEAGARGGGAGMRAGRAGTRAAACANAAARVSVQAGLGARARVRRAAARVLVLALAASSGATGCGASPETIPREEFIGAYVALRVAELEGAGSVISDAARDSVLAASGVTEEDLDAFVEAHGRDVVFMADIWTEVDSLMQQRSEGEDPGR